MNARQLFGRAGITITELMIAVMVLSVGVAGSFASFKYIVRALHVSRAHSLAANLAQEKIEILKNLNYYGLMVTTAAAAIPNISGSSYDTASYPAETIVIAGITYHRYSYVTLAEIHNDVITAMSYTYPDTGIKHVIVTVTWTDAGATKSYTLSNLLQNSKVNTLNSSISGTITKLTGGGALSSAYVQVQGYPDWNATSAADGTYSISVTSGYYTMRASSAQYVDAVSAQVYASPYGGASNVDLALPAIGTGTIAGYAWLSPNLVISQVVVSSQQAGGGYAQYVELYNPTTAQISIADCTPGPTCTMASPTVQLNMRPHASGSASDCLNVPLLYISTYVASYHYYLIANRVNIWIGGSKYTADAYYQTLDDGLCNGMDTSNNRILNIDKGGAVWVTNSAGSQIDAVGWAGGAGPPPSNEYEGSYINLTSNGMEENKQLVRISSPTANVSVGGDLETYGRAYDSGNNATDFWYNYSGQAGNAMTSLHPPYVSTAAAKLPIAGVPAVGAYVSASDPYSGSTQAYASYISSGSLSLLYAPFRLVGVSTTPASASCAGACWTVEIASNSYYAQISTVSVLQNITTWIPNTNTVAASTGGVPAAMMTGSSLNGFIEGNISNVAGANLSGIQVLINGVTKTTGSNGDYFISTSSGTATVIANVNYANNNYMQALEAPTVVTGQITTQDFILSQAGAIRGYVKAGSTPLPSILVSATRSGSEVGAASSDNTGFYTIRNLSTGTYTLTPILEAGVTSDPVWRNVAVNAGSTADASTFTITNAFGGIAGTVTYNGSIVTTGVLVIASTNAITTPPAIIYGSAAASTTPTYAISSLADGTYSLPVRSSASNYNVLAAMPIVSNNGTVTVIYKNFPGVTVSASQVTPKDLPLP